MVWGFFFNNCNILKNFTELNLDFKIYSFLLGLFVGNRWVKAERHAIYQCNFIEHEKFFFQLRLKNCESRYIFKAFDN